MYMSQGNLIVQIISVTIIFQIFIAYLFSLPYIDLISFLKNVIIVYLIADFLYNKTKNKNSIIMIVLYVFVYVLCHLTYPTYVGQDFISLPFNVIGHCMMNLHQLQNTLTHQKHIEDTMINLEDTRYNFWYEYYHFLHKDNIYYFFFNKPGKYDNYLNFYYFVVDMKENKKILQISKIVDKRNFTTSQDGYNVTSKFENNDINYESIINMHTKKKYIKLDLDNVHIEIDGNIIVNDNYSGVAVIDEYIPITKITKLAGVTDVYPYEKPNDTFCIAHSKITVNNIVSYSISWFDRYVGNGWYFMTNYLWVMTYTPKWYIFTLFYSDYPYNFKDTICVSFFYDTQSSKMVECSNFFPNRTENKLFCGSNMTINTYNTRLVDSNFKFDIQYKSQKIQCHLKSKNVVKGLDNFSLYKRLSEGLDYKEGEEIYKVMEQTRYNEFSGRSDVTVIYNNTTYVDEGICIIDGVDWENGKRVPDGYKEKEQSFLNDTFYVLHPNRDKLNGKIE